MRKTNGEINAPRRRWNGLLFDKNRWCMAVFRVCPRLRSSRGSKSIFWRDAAVCVVFRVGAVGEVPGGIPNRLPQGVT